MNTVGRTGCTDGKLRVAAVLAILAITAVQNGCSGPKPGPEHSSGPLQKIDPATVGEIKGVVTLQGTPPAPRKILLSGEPECAQLNPNGLVSSDVTTGANGAVTNAAVYIKSGLAHYHFDPPSSAVELAQKNCMYEPRVVALMTHQTLEIQNEDPIQHNVHPTPHDNPAFNFTQLIHGPPIQKTFAEPESAIRFMCNLHPWMRAYVFVFSHPYFDITSSAGGFDLKNVPPGTYTIEAWQEKYGTEDQTVIIGPSESKTVNFIYQD